MALLFATSGHGLHLKAAVSSGLATLPQPEPRSLSCGLSGSHRCSAPRLDPRGGREDWWQSGRIGAVQRSWPSPERAAAQSHGQSDAVHGVARALEGLGAPLGAAHFTRLAGGAAGGGRAFVPGKCPLLQWDGAEMEQEIQVEQATGRNRTTKEDDEKCGGGGGGSGAGARVG